MRLLPRYGVLHPVLYSSPSGEVVQKRVNAHSIATPLHTSVHDHIAQHSKPYRLFESANDINSWLPVGASCIEHAPEPPQPTIERKVFEKELNAADERSRHAVGFLYNCATVLLSE